MSNIAQVQLSDEEAAQKVQTLSSRQEIDLGSATLHFGLDDNFAGKLVVIASSGKCVMIDYPFAGSVSFR